MRIELNRLHFPVTALGPGRRVGIWVQGCSIECPGCLARDTWDRDGSRSVPVSAVIKWIEELPIDLIDGVTISGGEPFDQPEGLTGLLSGLRQWTRSSEVEQDIDLLAYSGYPHRKLRRSHQPALDLLDAIIPGPYQQSHPTELIWRGSANQRLVPLTELGRRRYAAFEETVPTRTPIQIEVDQSIWMVGVPRQGDLARLEQMLAAEGVDLEGVSWRA